MPGATEKPVKLTKAQVSALGELGRGLPSEAIKPAILKALERAGLVERHVPSAGHIMFRHVYRVTPAGRVHPVMAKS